MHRVYAFACRVSDKGKGKEICYGGVFHYVPLDKVTSKGVGKINVLITMSVRL